MPFTLPNPTVPTNGQSLDATPLLANLVAIANAIAAFDGSQINAGSVLATALAASANPNTLLNAVTAPFVQSGCVFSTVSNLNGTMSGGTIYYNGTPVTVNSVASHGFTASQDTYVDIDKNGNVAYQGVSNGGTAPSLTANSIRVAKVVTGGSAISSITLNGSDGIGNIIYPIGGLTPAKTQNPYKFSVYRNAAWTITSSGSQVIFDTKLFDTGSNYNTTTGFFTAPISGFYFFAGSVQYGTPTINNPIITALTRNSAIVETVRFQELVTSSGGNITQSGSTLIQLAAGDTTGIAARGFSSSGSGGVGAAITNFSGFLVSAT